MERRTFIASASSFGALLTAGCLGGSSGGESATTESATETATATPEPAPVPEPDLVFRTESGVLRAVHMGGDRITDADTAAVYVTVDGERTTTWVADDEATDAAGSYPVSIGNFVEVPAAEDGSTVEVVWVGRTGQEAVLATHDVAAPTPEPTTATETATDETVTENETATTTDATTAADETTTDESA